jgi:hypothetical protein
VAYKNVEDRNAYARKWYAENKAKHKALVKQGKAERKRLAKAYVDGVKSGPCLDCGGKFPTECMDLDHLRDKKANVSKMVAEGLSLETIKAEIAKCELVCANCHRIRTKNRR